MTFHTSQGSAATVYRRGGQIYNFQVSNFIRILCTKNHKNRMVFDGVIQKNNMCTFFETHCALNFGMQ